MGVQDMGLRQAEIASWHAHRAICAAAWTLAPPCLAHEVVVTWLHLRTHHLWRAIKEVGLLSE